MRQLANNSQRSSASTQTEQLDISDNDFNEFCSSMTSHNNGNNSHNSNDNNCGHYYAIPAELVASEQPVYDLPNCTEVGISSQTDLSLSFLDLSVTSDLDDEDDDIDFSSGDDYNERWTSRFRLNDVTSVIDEDDEEEEEEEEDGVDGNILLHDVGTGQFMLDLLDRIAPPTDSSSSNECTPTSSKGTSTSTSSSSSSSHGRCLEFDSDFKSGSSPNSEEATTEVEDQLPMRRLKKLKRQVPRMGTRLEMLPPRSTASILDNIFFPPPPPLTSPSPSPSPEFQALFQSAIPSRDSLSPTPYQQHVYQDLIFDYPEERVDNFNNNSSNNSSSINNSSDVVPSEAFYHVLSSEHVQEQQNFSDIQRIKKQGDNKVKAEHRVTFDLVKSSDEDIYENDYEVKSLLKNFSPEVKLAQFPPPLPKRPAQVKFTPRVQNSSGESASASPIFLHHSNQVVNQTAMASVELKEQPKLHKSSEHVKVSSGMPRERSSENPIRSKQESRKLKQSSSRIRSTNDPVGSDRKVVVIGEDGVDGGRGEIYGKLAEIMYTNRANLRHTIMLQQKLFQQQLQAGPSSRRPKSQLVPNSQNLDIAELAKQNPWNVLPQQNESVQSTDWVIRRRQDGTRYITRRNKHSKVKESKTSQREVDKNTIPRTVAMAPQTIMPIFRTRRNRDKPLIAAPKEGNKHHQLPNTKPMVQVDSFVALQNVLQGKMQVPNHAMPPKQNHSIGKPLLSVTTI